MVVAVVDQAVVVPVQRDNRVVDLILFVQLREDGDHKRSGFLRQLSEALPQTMRPRSVRFVDRLPVSIHGKVDRMCLLEPGRSRVATCIAAAAPEVQS